MTNTTPPSSTWPPFATVIAVFVFGWISLTAVLTVAAHLAGRQACLARFDSSPSDPALLARLLALSRAAVESSLGVEESK